MLLDSLEKLADAELQETADRCNALLKQRDMQRKDKALADARALLSSVGLSLKDIARKASSPKPKGPVYHAGRNYQHPEDRALVWNANGKKPAWLMALEKSGSSAVESTGNERAALPASKSA